MSNVRLEKLRQKREALDAQIRATEARVRAGRRKQETRRKVLAGAAVLAHAEHDPAFNLELRQLLERFLTRDDERALFGLATTPTGVTSDHRGNGGTPIVTGTG